MRDIAMYKSKTICIDNFGSLQQMLNENNKKNEETLISNNYKGNHIQIIK
jgi:hypothetical protein